MSLRSRIINALGGEIKVTNSRSNDFLRYGNRNDPLKADWSDIKMTDQDMYRGYSYAVIQKRANKVASLAGSNLNTFVLPKALDIYQEHEETPIHPYLKAIEDSTKFTEKQFWKTISIYLDLAGRYYLGVVRKYVPSSTQNLPDIVTDVKEFILLNPYEIRRVINSDGEVAGYIERKSDGRYREWGLHQIIEMREMNPFDNDSYWAMTDAAKEAVYTLNKSGDYTRQSLNGNIDAPGIITTDVILDDESFANFKARVVSHTKGEPLFGNGAGAITWNSMQVDLDKAALLDINEINRTTLFAVSGTSKTSLGIEQSGTTRETARVQSEQFVSDTAQPRLEDIIDFLNLDYKQHYKKEYDKIGYTIEIRSAVGADYDTETKAVGLRKEQFALAQELIYAGYSQDSAYQYAQGQIELQDLEQEQMQLPMGGKDDEESGEGGEPTPPEPTEPETPSATEGEPIEEEEQEVKGKIRVDNLDELDVDNPFLEHNHANCTCHNAFDIHDYEQGMSKEDRLELDKAYNNLLKDVRSVQKRAITYATQKVTINAFDENDIIERRQKNYLTTRLQNIFNKYWAILFPLFAKNLVSKRNKEFNENQTFTYDNQMQEMVENNAKEVAKGHVDTILKDVLEASNRTYSKLMNDAGAELILKAYRDDPTRFSAYFPTEPDIPTIKKAIANTDILEENRKIYARANKMVMEGYKRDDIIKAIQNEYDHLSDTRALTIVHNETSRAFGHSQYQADLQFLKNTGKLDTAYKELYSQTGDPCPYCQVVIDRGPIPFTQNFLNKGESIEIVENGKVKKFTANYEDINASTIHVNCQCRYRLVFLDEDGKVLNANTLRGENNTSSTASANTRDNNGSDIPETTKEINGGPGSGNFDHAGRLGEVGGSAPRKYGANARHFVGTKENPVIVDTGEESKRPIEAKLYPDGTVVAKYGDGTEEELTGVASIQETDPKYGTGKEWEKPSHEIKPSTDKDVRHKEYKSGDGDDTLVAEWEEVTDPIYPDEKIARAFGEIGRVPGFAYSDSKLAYAIRDGELRPVIENNDTKRDTELYRKFLKEKFNLTDSELDEELIKDKR